MSLCVCVYKCGHLKELILSGCQNIAELRLLNLDGLDHITVMCAVFESTVDIYIYIYIHIYIYRV